MAGEFYLDNAATTKVDSCVAENVLKVMNREYGNPSSLHRLGQNASRLVEDAREKIANFIGASSEEIYFTSGGTESNNLALKGRSEEHTS